MFPMFMNPKADGEPITVGTSVVTLASLLSATEFQKGTIAVTLINCDSTNNLYWAYKSSAPASKAVMAPIPAYQGWLMQMEPKDLAKVYVVADASLTAYVLQQGKV